MKKYALVTRTRVFQPVHRRVGKSLYNLFALALCLAGILKTTHVVALENFMEDCPCYPSTIQPMPTPDCCDHHARDIKRSRTYMFTRPLNENLNIDQALWNSIMYRKQKKNGINFNITPAYQNSLTREKTAQYFLPFCEPIVVVTGDNYLNTKKVPIVRAEWLGLPSDFDQSLTLNPKQRQAGCFVTFNQDIGTLMESDLLRGLWYEFKLPLVYVENNLKIGVRNTSGNPEQSAQLLRAFNNSKLLYAKICPCGSSAIELAEINFKFGRTYRSENETSIAYYSIFSIPTGNRQCPEYLFSPVVGNNHHTGFGGGVNSQILLNRDTSDVAICFFLDLECLFLIRHHERRTFDLMGKPWSRYLQLVNINDNLGDPTTFAANVLTRDVRVHPYCLSDFCMGYRFKTAHTEFEVGYNVWGHTREQIELQCRFEKNWGIAGNQTGVTPDMLAYDTSTVTASNSNISKQTPNNVNAEGKFIFVPLNESDLDLDTGAAQAALNQKVHGAIGFISNHAKVDGFFGFGGFYDWPQKNPALRTAGVWAKMGAGF